MKFESQLTSLELSKRLDELGVKQESLFYYQDNPYDDGTSCVDIMIKERKSINNENVIINIESENDNNPKYSAFTVAELGEMLPDWTETAKRAADDWVCIVRHKNDDINDHSFGKTEADARAKMLIYLLENGLIKND